MGTGPTVLIVDDDPGVRFTTARLLESAGIGFREAAGGDEAIAQVAEGDVHVLLMDLSMPGKSGIETLDALRAQGCELPVILTSGYTRAQVESALKDPRVRFLPKPFRAETLIDMVTSCLS